MTRRSLSYTAPPVVAIAIGATTPNPGVAPAFVYSSLINDLLLWNGTSWGAVGTSGRGSGMASVNFGVAGDTVATVAVLGQTNILSTSAVTVNVAAAASPDHSADEHVVEALSVTAGAIVPGIGFTIWGRSDNIALYGRYNIFWAWS